MKIIVILARFYYYSVFARFSMKPTYNQQLITYMRIGGRGGIIALLRVQKKVTGQRFSEE